MGYDIGKKVEAGKGDVLSSQILVKGTSISINRVLIELSQGKSINQLLEVNPRLTRSNFDVCFEYGHELAGALDLSDGMALISKRLKKRKAYVDRLRSLRVDPPDLFSDLS